jgi:hypothetical protein
LILAGRGFGKTRTGAEWVRQNLCGDTPLTGGRWRHIAIIAETAANARDVMVGDGKEPSNPSAGSASTAAHAGAAAAIWAAPSPNDSRRARRNPDVGDATYEDMTLRTKVRGQAEIERYLARALAKAPFGSGSKLRHVVGSDLGGGFEWLASSGVAGVTAIRLGGDGKITAITTVYDGRLLNEAALKSLSALSLDP